MCCGRETAIGSNVTLGFTRFQPISHVFDHRNDIFFRQGDSPPHVFVLEISARGPGHLAATQDVDVQVRNRFAAVLAVIDHQPVAAWP